MIEALAPVVAIACSMDQCADLNPALLVVIAIVVFIIANSAMGR